MKYEIAVCTKEGDSTTFKGDLLEKLRSYAGFSDFQSKKLKKFVTIT